MLKAQSKKITIFVVFYYSRLIFHENKITLIGIGTIFMEIIIQDKFSAIFMMMQYMKMIDMFPLLWTVFLSRLWTFYGEICSSGQPMAVPPLGIAYQTPFPYLHLMLLNTAYTHLTVGVVICAHVLNFALVTSWYPLGILLPLVWLGPMGTFYVDKAFCHLCFLQLQHSLILCPLMCNCPCNCS